MASRFEESIRALFAGNGNNTDYPMYETYVNYALSTNERGDSFTLFLSDYIDICGKSYLDVGTAYGGCLVAMKKKGCTDYLGVDIDERLIQIARDNLLQHNMDPDKVCVCDISQIDITDTHKNKYDIISCIDVVEHVLDIDITLDNMLKMMSSQGYLYLEIPNRYHVNNVMSDPHFGKYGITLLDRKSAIEYFNCFDGSPYTVGDYQSFEYFNSKFNKEFKVYNLSKVDTGCTVINDELFSENVLKAHKDKVNNFNLSPDLKEKLLVEFEKYISNYLKQVDNPDLNRFHVQSWKLLITRNDIFIQNAASSAPSFSEKLRKLFTRISS